MPTSATVQAALVTAVKSITTANGYTTNITPTNVSTTADVLAQGVQLTADKYPRVFVITDGAAYTDRPSHCLIKEEKFTVIAVFAKNVNNLSDVALDTQVQNFVADFEKMIDRNKQLGSSRYVQLDKYATDVGVNDPEAVCVFELTITFEQRFASTP
jgi:hypothetical protein